MVVHVGAPLEAVIEGDAKITIGEKAVVAIRGEQLAALMAAEERVDKAFDGLGFLDQLSARGELEELSAALGEARDIVSALWWLAKPEESAA